MSIRVMTLVWDGFPASGSELLAMLALADWCDDKGGSLYPSIEAVAEKIRLGEKQARRILRSFEEEGYLTVVKNAYGGAPGTTKQWRLNIEKLKELVSKKEFTPPACVTPPASVTPPTGGSPTPPAHVPDPSRPCPFTPPAHGSLTTNEPSIEPSGGESAAAPWPLPKSLFEDFLKVRDAKRAGPLTETAKNAMKLEIEKAGITLKEAVTACCQYSWPTFTAIYYAERTGKALPGAVTPVAPAKGKAQPYEANYVPPISSIWHESATGITAKAVELGLKPQDLVMESSPVFKARVMAAFNRSAA